MERRVTFLTGGAMMQRQELDMQADRIEMLLQDHKTPARVTGGNVTPRWVQFLLQPAPGIKVNKVEALSREIAIALGATTARVKAEGGAVKVEVPRHDPQPVSLMRLCCAAARQSHSGGRGGAGPGRRWRAAVGAAAFARCGARARRRHDRLRQDRAGADDDHLAGVAASSPPTAIRLDRSERARV